MNDLPWKAAGPWIQAFAVTLLAAGLAFALEECDGAVHLPFLFLAASVVASSFWGRGPGILSAIAGTVLLDFLFLPPRFSLRLSVQDLLSLVLLLAIAIFIGRLADRQRREALQAREGQERAQATARLARELAGSVTHDQVVANSIVGIQVALGADVRISSDPGETVPQGWTTFPLSAPRKNRGSLLVGRQDLSEREREFAETLASLVGLAVERVHFVEVARDALLRIEGERLRNRILSTLSHDLRTPLTGIIAGMEALNSRLDRRDDEERHRIREVADEARRMADLVENLLELSRIQSGGATLRRDWNSPVELAAAALRQRGRALGNRPVAVEIAEDAPLVWCDGVLVERVLVNLLDNAHRHTPPGTPIRLWLESVDGACRLGLDDRGPGFPESVPLDGEGTGIGLSLCRSIAAAHGGRLDISTAPGGGARAVLVLPQDRRPPDPPAEDLG